MPWQVNAESAHLAMVVQEGLRRQVRPADWAEGWWAGRRDEGVGIREGGVGL